jgi:hypothetical protein
MTAALQADKSALRQFARSLPSHRSIAVGRSPFWLIN